MPDDTPLTIPGLIAAAARRFPDRPALLAPGRPALSHLRLAALSHEVAGALAHLGLGRVDRVAVVLPNGPELAAAFLTFGGAAACAPLNPDYREAELDFYLADLRARAVVVRRGVDSPARAAARKLGAAVIELAPGDEAGWFTLDGPSVPGKALEPATPDDVALLLHTSGTTSRPKLVPLSHGNVCTTARNIVSTLRLTADDCCLNVMPLFHIHGLIGATLSSLAAGAAVACAPGFDAERFFGWLEETQATWYTAAPTIHQAVLVQAGRQPNPPRGRLRFIRSSAAALAPAVMGELEAAFGVPVIELYGMTESAYQMTSNPLPPGERKAGSVGVPAGPEMGVMDEGGALLGAHAVGELVVRGPSVTAGYENNPEANAQAFRDGWFRTGDQGYRDEQGRYYLTGRFKELINRGGEKIAPREIDEVLLSHPAVARAVTFAVPHAQLGENIAAAVELLPGATTTEGQVREWALQRLAAHKVPAQVVFVEAIPKGATGKLQRIGLHEALGHLLHAEYVAPAGPVEEAVAGAWREVLDLGRVGARDNFFFLGGDSLLASRLATRLRDRFAVDVTLDVVFRGPTVAEQALAVEELVLGLVERLPVER